MSLIHGQEKAAEFKMTAVRVGPDGSVAVASVFAANGDVIYPDSWPQSYAYNGDGSLNYIQITGNGATYRQTFSYSAGQLTSISGWVKQ